MALKGEAKKAWRKSYAERKSAYMKKWFASPVGLAYKERTNARDRERRRLARQSKGPRPRKSRAYRNIQTQIWRERLRSDAVTALGGCCACCGIADTRVLEFDHITPLLRRTNGVKSKDATREISTLMRSGRLSDVIQLLCANCHAIKTREDDAWSLRFEAECSGEDALVNQLSLL